MDSNRAKSESFSLTDGSGDESSGDGRNCAAMDCRIAIAWVEVKVDLPCSPTVLLWLLMCVHVMVQGIL